MEFPAERINPLPNLAECAREPIQIIGHIQPHGLLFALSEPDLIIRQVSFNVVALLGMSPETLLGCSIESVLGAQQFETFRSQVSSDEPLSAKRLRITANGRPIKMHCIAHRHDGVLIVELDLARGTHSLEPLELDSHIQIPLGRMERASDIVELFRLAAEEIRRLSGFDRVMVYRFDESWNGEVIAEAVGAALPVYLGSRFPESDIPAQARQLFLMNPSRSIADVAAKPVPIIPEIGPLTGKPLGSNAILFAECGTDSSQVFAQYGSAVVDDSVDCRQPPALGPNGMSQHPATPLGSTDPLGVRIDGSDFRVPGGSADRQLCLAGAAGLAQSARTIYDER